MSKNKRISKEEVERIAELARISLNEEEKERFSKELSDILDYIRQLEELNTDQVKPVSQVSGLFNVVREDIAESGDEDERKIMMDNFPDREGDYIKVKQIL